MSVITADPFQRLTWGTVPTWHRGMTMSAALRRIRPGRSAAVAAGAFLLALVPVTAAQAATPIHFTFTNSDSFPDTTSVLDDLPKPTDRKVGGWPAQWQPRYAFVHSARGRCR